MSEKAVEEAKAKLWAYINSLPPDEHKRAVEYQAKLEAMAAATEGGMPQVILNEMRHHAASMEEISDEVNEIIAGVKSDALIKKVQR